MGQLRFVFCILPTPGTALDFQEETELGFLHLIKIYEELFILVFDEPAQTILFDRNL